MLSELKILNNKNIIISIMELPESKMTTHGFEFTHLEANIQYT